MFLYECSSFESLNNAGLARSAIADQHDFEEKIAIVISRHPWQSKISAFEPKSTSNDQFLQRSGSSLPSFVCVLLRTVFYRLGNSLNDLQRCQVGLMRKKKSIKIDVVFPFQVRTTLIFNLQYLRGRYFLRSPGLPPQITLHDRNRNRNQLCSIATTLNYSARVFYFQKPLAFAQR